VNPSPVEYREDLDAGLLEIAGICVLAAVMASLDIAVVSVAQRTFITEFHTSQAVVAWTMTGNYVGPGNGDPADRLGGQPVRHQAALAVPQNNSFITRYCSRGRARRAHPGSPSLDRPVQRGVNRRQRTGGPPDSTGRPRRRRA
jgi:hypothetical protein